MKKIFLFVSLCILTFFVKAQYPITQNIGSGTTKVQVPSPGGFQASLINRSFSDTTAANLTYIDAYPGAQIFTTDNLMWVRNATATRWLSVSTTGGGSSDCGLETPGYVVWDSLLIFTITPSIYKLCCDGIERTSSLANVTLAAADPTLPRFDGIFLDSTGVVVSEGTPAADPVLPQPTGCQIVLTYIYVPNGSTTPGGGIAQAVIYDQTGGSEWTPAASGVTMNFSNTNNPYHLTIAADAGATTGFTSSFTFTKGSTIVLSDYTTVTFYLRLKTGFSTGAAFGIYFQNTTNNLVSRSAILQSGQYNFVNTTLGSYQTIVIPMSAFLGGATTIVDKLVFLALSDNASGFYIDWIQLGGGITQPGGTGSGTVTSFQSNDLDPLFTTTVTNATTTPTLSFTQEAADPYTVFGNFTNGSAVPTFGAVDLSTAAVTGELPVTNIALGCSSCVLSSDGVTNSWQPTTPGYDTTRVLTPLLVLSGVTKDTLSLPITVGSASDSTLFLNRSTGYLQMGKISGATTVPINGLLAATGTNNIDNAAYQQKWTWNSLTSGYGLRLESSNLNAASSTQVLFIDSLSGENNNASQTTYASKFYNTHTGTTSTNVAGYFSSTLATNNYAIIVPASSGNVGIGTSTPTATRLEVVDNAVGAANMVSLTSTSTVAASNAQKLLNIDLSGANATASQSTYGIYSSNTHTGTGSFNYAGYFNATGGAFNYGVFASADNTAIKGSTSSGTGVYGTSSSGIGVIAESNSSYALGVTINPTATNTVVEAMHILRSVSPASGTGSGAGVKVTFATSTNNNSNTDANTLISKWTDATHATRTSQFILTGTNNAASDDLQRWGDRVTLTESSATTFTSTTIATGKIGGGEIIVTVTADDATDYQARTLRYIWAAENKAGTLTITISTPEEVVAVSSGTLTCAITGVDAGSGVLNFQANAVSSLTQTTLRCSYTFIKNF